MLVTNPIPEQYSMDADVINKAINEAVEEAKAQGIHGKATTPFLLAKIKDITGGSSLAANIQLVYNNAKLARPRPASWPGQMSQPSLGFVGGADDLLRSASGGWYGAAYLSGAYQPDDVHHLWCGQAPGQTGQMAGAGKDAVPAAAVGRQRRCAAGYAGVSPQDEALVFRLGRARHTAGTAGTGGLVTDEVRRTYYVVRKAVPADIPAVTAIYEALLDREERGELSTGWTRGVYPTEQTALDAWLPAHCMCWRTGDVCGRRQARPEPDGAIQPVYLAARRAAGAGAGAAHTGGGPPL